MTRTLHRAVVVACVATTTLVTLAAGLALAAAVVVPRLGGATPYAVLTSSMEPGLPPGTLVVVRPVAAQRVAPGDVVTYQLLSGRPVTVTHRVVETATTLGGRVALRTQGDANAVPDRAWVREEQLRGELWYAVPHLGRLHVSLTASQHHLLVRLAAGALGLHALVMFARAARERRSRSEEVRRAAPVA